MSKTKFNQFKKVLATTLKANKLPAINVRNTDFRKDDLPGVFIEAWSTHKYSYRKSDGRFIFEGKPNDGIGLSPEEVIERVVEDVQAWQDYIKLNESIDPTRQFIAYGDTVINYEGVGRGFYRVTFSSPTSAPGMSSSKPYMDVEEFSAKDAWLYARKWFRGIPTVGVKKLCDTFEEWEANHYLKSTLEDLNPLLK